MSRPRNRTMGHQRRFPRVSGDEPYNVEQASALYKFSPRERG